jgi:serine/threonine protein kinase
LTGEKGNLTKIVKKGGGLPEAQVASYFKDVAEGVQYLHTGGLAHRSLSTDLIVVTGNNRAKICGLQSFGEICDVDQNCEPTPCWMTHDQNPFISPESLAVEPHCPFAEDIWSYGVCMYTCLCGGYPFDGYKDREKLILQTTDKLWSKKDRSKALSVKAKQLLGAIFQLEPIRRPVADELLKDKFFTP